MQPLKFNDGNVRTVALIKEL